MNNRKIPRSVLFKGKGIFALIIYSAVYQLSLSFFDIRRRIVFITIAVALICISIYFIKRKTK